MTRTRIVSLSLLSLLLFIGVSVQAQLPDATDAPNTLRFGIAKTFPQQVGAGRGTVNTPNSSLFIISRDPFRAIRRGRQIFQRKFDFAQGLGPRAFDGVGDLDKNIAIGAGVSDSCAGCHGRPRGSAGFGGDVVTRPDSRDAPHLFGLGIKEMLGDEITTDLRNIRAAAIAAARSQGRNVTRALVSKNIRYGSITARPNGTVDSAAVQGVDQDLRVRPFFAHGGTISIREFIVGAFNNEMGLQSVDPDTTTASQGRRVVTPGGMILDGSLDKIEFPLATSAADDPDGDGHRNEVPTSIVDFMEFYLLNYFKPALYKQTLETQAGLVNFMNIGCGACHIPDLTIDRDRRVADVNTLYDPNKQGFNTLFSVATPLLTATPDNSGFPPIKRANGRSFFVGRIFTDFKRHDVGPSFYERNYDGTIQKEFMSTPLWGVGSTGPYGHDGRSANLTEVILRHGGEAQQARDNFASLNDDAQLSILTMLNSLILFPPDDTASNLDPANPAAPGFPQAGHGSIKLGVLFNNP